MGMAMFKRTFGRTIPDNLRAPHMKMWGFRGNKGQKVHPNFALSITMEFHYHALFFPDSRGLFSDERVMVAHVRRDLLSRYSCRATRVAAAVSRYTPPPLKRPCRTCRPSTVRGVARQAASVKRGGGRLGRPRSTVKKGPQSNESYERENHP